MPWPPEASVYTLLFEAPALSLRWVLPVRQAAGLLRVAAKCLWTRLAHCIPLARTQDGMRGVRRIGVDETGAKKRQDYITVPYDLEQKRLLFACCPGRDQAGLGTAGIDHLAVLGPAPPAGTLQTAGPDPVERLDGVVRGMLDGRGNGFVEAMNGLLQQTKTVAPGFCKTENFIAIACLRMSKLKHCRPPR